MNNIPFSVDCWRLDYIDSKYDWNCMVLLQDWLNIVEPKIARGILKMRKLLEVEDFMAQRSFKDNRVTHCNSKEILRISRPSG